MENFTPKDYWRSIILYGLNSATYKMAFAETLNIFIEDDKSKVSMTELAEVFFELYLDRLENGMPQLNFASRTTVIH